MAKNEIGEYDETDSGNTDITGIGLSDATLIDQLDNIARAQMGALKRWFKSSLFRLRDSTDQTKLLAFDLSGLTTATTRTLTVPDGSSTLVTNATPPAAKFWADINVTAGVPSIAASFNVTSITDIGVGQVTVTIGTDFASANWACFPAIASGGGTTTFPNYANKFAGSVTVQSISLADTFVDPRAYSVAGFGAQ